MASSGNGASTESMYVGRTGGIFRFVDEGQNWENIANHEVFGAWNRLFKVIIDPISPTTLFVATKDGLYKGTNCNTSNPTWNEVEDGFFYDIEYKPGSNSLLYATAFINGAWKVMNSTDYGQSWQAMIPQPPGIFNTNVIRDNRFTIEVSKAKPDSLYLATRHLSSFNFYYLDVPNATSWSPIGNYTGGDFEFGDGHGFGVDQTNGVDILTSKGLRIAKYNISTGIVWSNADVVHVDVEDIIYHPYNTNEVWACTHGGVEKSPDGGVNWTDKYNGLGVAQVELMATSFSNPEYVMAGLYHDGTQLTQTQYSQNWNPQWEHVFDWDGMKPVIDNKDPNNMWASGQEGVWAYSDVKFNNQYYTQFSNYRSAFFHNVGVINKQNSSIFFWNQFSDTGIEDVYRSDGYGLTGTGVTNEFISEFSLLFPSSHEVYILGLVTPYTDENYLLAFIRDEHYDSNNNKEQRWHLFRTTNANNQNVAWTELDIPTDEWTISSVEFHPENPDIIYLAYTEPPSGFYATPEDFVVKIDYTIPSNPDIEDLTGNLQHTYTRANCLAAVNDNNDGLYFATEFGVFYTNSELQEQTNEEWKLVGTKLPHCRNTGLEINYFCNKLRIGTHGRGTWELPLPCDLNTQALEISTDTTWNSFMRIDRIVNVNSGATLTISSDARVGFLEDAKIIVKPGGKLVIDGGTLTNGCDGSWQGIEVRGNPSATQIPANQGWLVITDGGKIENAEMAVRVGSEDYTNKGGGLVFATDGEFLNNDIGVWFDPYSYVAYNNSHFTRCTFNFTNPISGEGNFIFAKLNDVHEVDFAECTFTNNSGQDHMGKGIESTNAIFNVEGIFSSPDWTYTLFQNLEYGIYATASNSTDLADVRHTTFTDNHHGIYLSGMTLPRVTSNEFTLDTRADDEGYGLYLDGCNQYWVEDNNFEGSDSPNSKTGIGIYVNESGNQANEIYLNSFDYVEYAVIALGVNRHSRSTATGLQILCNDYNNTLFDETIIYDGINDPPEDGEGIASNQGQNTTNAVDMAGNLFYYNTSTSGDYDDLDNESNHFNYYYSDDAGVYKVEPLDLTGSTVTKQSKPIADWTYAVGCPSGLTSGGGGGGTEESRSTMMDAQSDIATTEAVLMALVDGGDTETLNTEVETSIPPEAAEVYTELMAESPNLSEIVVETSIEKEEVLPNAMIRDVMVANPHTAASLILLSKLDDRTNPMPAYMKAQILAGRSLTSLKADLEGQIAGHKLRKARAMNHLARYFGAMQEDPAVTDSLLALYQSDNSLDSRYMQAWLHLHNGQYQQGQAVITAIPTAFALTADELALHQNMQWIYTTMKGLFEAGNGVDELSQAQIGQLQGIVSDETCIASVYARNLLLAIDEMEYEEPVILPNHMKSTEVEEAYNELLNTPAPKMLEVYPNPSKDFVILAYQFDKETQGKIEIRDVSGRLMESIPFSGIQDQVTVTTRAWTPGVYVLSLIIQDKVIETTKFTLVN